ncbi:MAG: CCA tRNA nucleotidyltransferase [Bryobacterales bacterium]|nr:CCA tRNA nucleotidyltransferase [Bryobacterales bacterium]
MQIPSNPAQILHTLHAAGHRAYLVGGCVRDMLLARQPKDWDVATSAPPSQLARLFPGAEPIGAHFGVILWHGVEIATFRSDGPYPDGRHPESVTFETDPAKDAARRDFTINGLFYDSQTHSVLDFVHGQQDLHRKVIRAIGVPGERFAEDHLRLLRAVRFAARFEFEIEPETARAIRAHARDITKVAAERTRDELTKILTEPHPRRGFELLDELRLLEVVLPEVKAMQGIQQPPEFHPEGDVWVHTLLMLEQMREPSITQAWGVLLHDVGKPPTFEQSDRIRFNGHAELGARMARQILSRLKYPTHVIDAVTELVAQHMKFMAVRQMKESTRKRFLRQDIIPELMELHRLDCQSSHGKMDAYNFCRQALAELPPEALRPPRLLTGADLVEMGIPQGPQIGELLRKLEDAQLEGQITTRAEALVLIEGAQ